MTRRKSFSINQNSCDKRIQKLRLQIVVMAVAISANLHKQRDAIAKRRERKLWHISHNKSIICQSLLDYEKIINKTSALDTRIKQKTTKSKNRRRFFLLPHAFKRIPNKVAYCRRKSIWEQKVLPLLCVKW